MRASQFIAYLNWDKYPTKEESRDLFTHLSIDRLKGIRRDYRTYLKSAPEGLSGPSRGEKCQEATTVRPCWDFT